VYRAFSFRDDTPPNGTGVVRIERNCVRMQPFPEPSSGPSPGFGAWLKLGDNSPPLAIVGNVVLQTQPASHGDEGVPADADIAECHDNVLVWLGGGDPPGHWPASCFTVTTDPGVWDACVAGWHARHG
jgi:hypothetical protein